ncbi:MAG: SpoIIE family protein phosphatase [Candidatus Eremiobacteraeota bacterium]|nr:SpoIIE family protein phosphatase [Candidatus Eremiobacteraeota bacterium]
MRNLGIAFKLSFSILLFTSLIVMGIFIISFIYSWILLQMELIDVAKYSTSACLYKMESELLPIERTTQSLASFLEHSRPDSPQVRDLLKTAAGSSGAITGFAVASGNGRAGAGSFVSYGKDRSRFAESKESPEKLSREEWYRMPRERGTPSWSEPYGSPGGRAVMATYSVPFYLTMKGTRQFEGVAAAEVSLAPLQEIISSMKAGGNSYSFLISGKGTFIFHPDERLAMKESLFSLPEELSSPELSDLGRDMLREASEKPRGFFDSHTKQYASLMYAPLGSTGWSLGMVFNNRELMSRILELARKVFTLFFAGCALLLVVTILVARTITKPLRVLAQRTGEVARGNLDFELVPLASKDEVGQLTDRFISMRDSLKNYIKELTETTAAKERMESELKVAHEIQMGMLPKKFPPFPERPECDIYAFMKPARAVGGDFFDFFFIDGSHLLMVIGDVAGKGVPAALLMAKVCTFIRTIAYECRDPQVILDRVNKEISIDNDSCMFVTIFCALLDVRSGEMIYSNGGHNKPLLVRESGEVGFLGGAGCEAVGIDEDAAFRNEAITFKRNDRLVLYTDGVTEAFNVSAELYSNDRLCKIVKDHFSAGSMYLVQAVAQDVQAFAGKAEQSDDITVMVLQYN